MCKDSNGVERSREGTEGWDADEGWDTGEGWDADGGWDTELIRESLLEK